MRRLPRALVACLALLACDREPTPIAACIEAEPQRLPPADAIVLADINHDGLVDLVGVELGARQLSVALGRPDGTYAASQPLTPCTNTSAFQWRSVAFGDVNGDGFPDLFVSGELPDAFGNPTAAIAIALNSGDGQFDVLLPKMLFGVAPSALLVDVDGDGLPDLVTRQSGMLLSVTHLGPAPRFVSTPFSRSGGALTLLSSAPRGAVEIAIEGDAFTLLRSQGDGSFAVTASAFAGPTLGESVETLSATTGPQLLTLTSDPSGFLAVNLWLRAGSTFSAGDTLSLAPAFPATGSMVADDVNSDGLADLVVLRQPNICAGPRCAADPGGLVVVPQESPDHFGRTETLPLDGPRSLRHVPNPSGGQPLLAVLGDSAVTLFPHHCAR